MFSDHLASMKSKSVAKHTKRSICPASAICVGNDANAYKRFSANIALRRLINSLIGLFPPRMSTTCPCAILKISYGCVGSERKNSSLSQQNEDKHELNVSLSRELL